MKTHVEKHQTETPIIMIRMMIVGAAPQFAIRIELLLKQSGLLINKKLKSQ